MRILWLSNARHVGTGYGVQTDLFVPRIKKLGHDIAISTFYGLQGTPQMDADDILTLPQSKDSYSNDIIAADAERFKADIVISLIDAWVLNPQVYSQFRWCPWFPKDCDPLPQAVLNSIRVAYRPFVYSLDAKRALDEIGMQNDYIPHGVDTNVYKPMDKIEARKTLNAPPELFLVGIVAANKGSPSRKCFDQQIRGFKLFHDKHPDSMLYIHTDFYGGHGGEDIKRLVQLAGLSQETVAEPPPYEFQRGMLGADYMVKLYNSFDVLLNATRGEGFGVPIIESMACGTPAIVGDWTAMPELVDAGAGWKVPYSDRFFYQNSYQFVPDVQGIATALELAYQNRDNAFLKEQARAGVVANYDADYVTQTYWRPVLERIAGEIEAVKAKQTERAAKREALRLVKPEPVEAHTNGDKPAEAVATGGAV